MNRILDYLNNRSFDINTVDGAKSAAYHLLRNEPERLAHTEGVVQQLNRILNQLPASQTFKDTCRQAAHLHDVGYSTDFAFTDFHPYDGFIYLKENSWNSEICDAVLHHTFASSLAFASRRDLKDIYRRSNPSAKTESVIELVTIADLHTLPDGSPATIEDRIDEIAKRHGQNSLVTQNLINKQATIQSIISRWPDINY